jgi:hypothetical protein
VFDKNARCDLEKFLYIPKTRSQNASLYSHKKRKNE